MLWEIFYTCTPRGPTLPELLLKPTKDKYEKKQKSVACIFHGVSTEEECNRAHEGKSPLQGLVAWLPKKCLLRGARKCHFARFSGYSFKNQDKKKTLSVAYVVFMEKIVYKVICSKGNNVFPSDNV